MSHTSTAPNSINKKRENRITKQLVGCNSTHLLAFKPKSADVVSRKYLYHCLLCLNLDFDQCDQINTDLVTSMSDQENRSLDKDDEE